MNVRKSCGKVSSIELPEGWQRCAADNDIVVDAPLTATALYTKPDKGKLIIT